MSSTSPMPTGCGAPQHARVSPLAYVGFVHGIIMCIAFSVFFPVGGILLRALQGKKVARIHAYFQTVSWALAIAGFSTGVYVAANGGHGTFTSRNGHKQIGLVVIIIMTLQPFIGIFHHLLYKKHERSTWYGLLHRILGRTTLIMGAINVGLGLQLGRANVVRTVIYSIITAFFFGAYFTVTLLFGPEAQKCKILVRSANATPRDSGIDTTETGMVQSDVEKEGSRLKV